MTNYPRKLSSFPKVAKTALSITPAMIKANFKIVTTRKNFEENNRVGITKLIQEHGGIDFLQPITREPTYYVRCGDKQTILINYLTDATLIL